MFRSFQRLSTIAHDEHIMQEGTTTVAGSSNEHQMSDFSGNHHRVEIFRDTRMSSDKENEYIRISTQIWMVGFTVLAGIIALFLIIGPSYENRYFSDEDQLVTKKNDGLFSKFNLQYAPLPTHVTKIAFGSCNSQHYPDQPHWETLMYGPFQPDLLLLLGDNVYGACNDTDCTTLVNAYSDLALHKSFQSLTERIPIMATLDDGDYGLNDANRYNPYKDAAISIFHEFFQTNFSSRTPNNSLNKGVYQSREFFMDNEDNDSILQIIVLDTRYSRDEFTITDEPMAPQKEAYMPDTNTTKTLLGDEQWKWLNIQLERNAVLRVIVSSIQVISDGTGFECWRMLPHERERLYSTLSNPPGGGKSIIVSGDHHVGGIYEFHYSSSSSDSLFDVTASSWTHTIPLGAFGSNCTTSEECDEKDLNRRFEQVRTNHFGSIEIDWKHRSVTLSIRRTETSPGYYHPQKFSNAGSIIQNVTLEF